MIVEKGALVSFIKLHFITLQLHIKTRNDQEQQQNETLQQTKKTYFKISLCMSSIFFTIRTMGKPYKSVKINASWSLLTYLTKTIRYT